MFLKLLVAYLYLNQFIFIYGYRIEEVAQFDQLPLGEADGFA